jgi:NAD(P)-dependent dehydrogenase (short-subunit alcohol dehydrogenase family)
MARYKPSSEAERQHRADVALAGRRAELLAAAREAESRLRAAQDRLASEAELHRLAVELDTALTEAVRAAYAAQRAQIGPRGYEDRIYRRKAMATPRVHALTAEAEHLLTLRETHRLNGIPYVPFEPSPEASPFTRA